MSHVVDSTHRQSESRGKWVLVGALFLIALINYADRTAITAVYPLLKSELGFTDIGLGAIGSVFLWSYALASPLSGYAGDRLNRERVVLWSLIGWSLVTLLSGLVNARWQLLGMRLLLGVIESLFLPAAMALIAEYHPAKTCATALGIVGVGQYLGFVMGGTLAGYLGDHHGWRSSLITLGVAGLVIAIFSYFLMPMNSAPPGAVNSQGRRSASQLSFVATSVWLLKIPSFVVLAAAGALTSIGAWIFINWLPLYFKETFAMSLASAAFFGSSVVSVSAAASQLFGGMASDRLASKGLRYRMLMQAVFILAAAPALLVFLRPSTVTVVTLALVIYSVFRNVADLNMLPLLADLAGADKSATAFGITNMVNTLVGGIGVFIAGFLKADYGLAGVFAGVAAILAIDSLLLFVGYFVYLKKDLVNA